MKNSSYILFFCFFFSYAVHGQQQLGTAPFSAASTFLEPDGRKDALKISDEEFVTLSKVRGTIMSDSEFALEKYNTSLKTIFKTPVIAGPEEDFKEIFYNGTDIVLLSVIHQLALNTTKLVAYGFDGTTGVKKWDKVIDETKINTWLPLKNRGAVKQSFENTVSGALARNYVTPIQYQYEIKFSPDKKSFLAYNFDYSQKKLAAKIKLVDLQANVLKEDVIGVDDNFINYGLFPNNKQEIFIVNVDRMGRMVVIKYTLETKASQLMDIQYSSSNRIGVKAHVLDDNTIYLACIIANNNKLSGIMYSKFNFQANLVEKINVHDISEGLMQTAKIMRQDKNITSEESWENYEITDFEVNPYEKIILILEKREIRSVTEKSDPLSTNDIEHWKEREGKVFCEGMILLSFNKDDELLWENFYFKSQSNDVSVGLISASYTMNISVDGKIRMIYANSDNSSGIYNQYMYLEWDELTGSKLKEMPLPNEEKLGILRGFTVWWDDKVAVVGRKGILGKKSVLNLYKI